LNSSGNSPYVKSSLTRRWVCLLWIRLAFRQRTYRTFSVLQQSLPFALYTNPMSVQALQSRSCLYYVSYVTTTAQSLERSKAWPPPRLSFSYFFVSGFTLSYTANMFILMIPYDLCLSHAQFCYIGKIESLVQIVDWYAPWKISSCAQSLLLHALQF
jgi:hypothetical protein